MIGICGGDLPVTCRAGCLSDLRTTWEQEEPEEEAEAAEAPAGAEAAAHPVAPAQAAAAGAASCEQTERGAASRKRKRAAEPAEGQPSLARIPCPVCGTCQSGNLLSICWCM